MQIFPNILVFLFGAIVGSFLNVCIYRLPDDLSIVSPASRCPRCGTPVRFYDNIPLLSYLLLRGRCRQCREKISWQYPLVELLSALAALVVFHQFGFSWPGLVVFIFIASLLVISFIDLEHKIIPDVITLPGIPVFFLAGVFILGMSFIDALLGVLIGGGVLFVIGYVYQLITKREGMGGGDIKLLAMLGGFLGWQSLIFIVLVSSLLGAIVGLLTIMVKGGDMKYALPFGPFLSLAAAGYIFFGQLFWEFLFLVSHLY
ncbi:MAG: prepilin peptidase [Smithellaceae bacterium]|nr:prepilin peptidase [Smithellaceae bacterium]